MPSLMVRHWRTTYLVSCAVVLGTEREDGAMRDCLVDSAAIFGIELPCRVRTYRMVPRLQCGNG